MLRKMTKERFVKRMLEDIAAREQAEADAKLEALERKRRLQFIVTDYKHDKINERYRKYRR